MKNAKENIEYTMNVRTYVYNKHKGYHKNETLTKWKDNGKILTNNNNNKMYLLGKFRSGEEVFERNKKIVRNDMKFKKYFPLKNHYFCFITKLLFEFNNVNQIKLVKALRWTFVFYPRNAYRKTSNF